MAQKDPTPKDDKEKKGQAPAVPETREGLEELKDQMPERPGLFQMVQDMLKNKGQMTEDEKKKKVGALLGLAALRLVFGDNKKKDKPAEGTDTEGGETTEAESAGTVTAEQPDVEVEEEGSETDKPKDPREKRRKVVCDDLRLICINTDPAGSRRPSHLAGRSTYLTEYGLPEFDTFKEEMMSILAPGVTDEHEAMKKVISVLQVSPMGKYQCMPQYLFQYVSKFKPLNLKWFREDKDKDLDKKLHAMWEFLQSEELQKEAARGYLSSSARQYNNDPELVAASFYGGSRAADALKAYKEGTATPEQIRFVEKKQGAYNSIADYAKTSKGKGGFDIEAELARTASRESGNLQGKKAKARDETWEQDQRFAYNRTEQTETDTAVA